MRRWVLQEHVWNKLLDQSGFTRIRIDLLPAETHELRDADTLLIACTRPG